MAKTKSVLLCVLVLQCLLSPANALLPQFKATSVLGVNACPQDARCVANTVEGRLGVCEKEAVATDETSCDVRGPLCGDEEICTCCKPVAKEVDKDQPVVITPEPDVQPQQIPKYPIGVSAPDKPGPSMGIEMESGKIFASMEDNPGFVRHVVIWQNDDTVDTNLNLVSGKVRLEMDERPNGREVDLEFVVEAINVVTNAKGIEQAVQAISEICADIEVVFMKNYRLKPNSPASTWRWDQSGKIKLIKSSGSDWANNIFKTAVASSEQGAWVGQVTVDAPLGHFGDLVTHLNKEKLVEHLQSIPTIAGRAKLIEGAKHGQSRIYRDFLTITGYYIQQWATSDAGKVSSDLKNGVLQLLLRNHFSAVLVAARADLTAKTLAVTTAYADLVRDLATVANVGAADEGKPANWINRALGSGTGQSTVTIKSFLTELAKDTPVDVLAGYHYSQSTIKKLGRLFTDDDKYPPSVAIEFRGIPGGHCNPRNKERDYIPTSFLKLQKAYTGFMEKIKYEYDDTQNCDKHGLDPSDSKAFCLACQAIDRACIAFQRGAHLGCSKVPARADLIAVKQTGTNSAKNCEVWN